MDLPFYGGVAGAEAVACDLLFEAGYQLEIFDNSSAKRLWVLSIRGKINGRWLKPERGYLRYAHQDHQADWSIGSGRTSMELWVRTDMTEVLFAQIQKELEGPVDYAVAATEPQLGFPDDRRRSGVWSGIQTALFGLGDPGYWGVERSRLIQAAAELTQEELRADPNGAPRYDPYNRT